MQDLPLAAYADDPIYNMKAVTQRTGIPAATLRAWERRYHALAPRRSHGNYRLYSERDIATLHWLKVQLDAGLSISRAVALLERLRGMNLEATLPAQGTPGTAGEKAEMRAPEVSVANWDQLSSTLFDALVSPDEQQAGEVMAEAFALYTVEDVCTNLITPTLARIGEAWFEQKINVAQEHFASAYLMARLMSLFNAGRKGSGPLILVSCAPTERHELGALMLALLLRRAGHNVLYLGADMPLADLVKAILQWQPRVVALSAVMLEALNQLGDLANMLQSANVRTHLTCGGHGFTLPEAHDLNLPCDYIGTDLKQSVQAIEQLLLTEPQPPAARLNTPPN
jgi:methanogenic corrinoid protein MtbC1